MRKVVRCESKLVTGSIMIFKISKSVIALYITLMSYSPGILAQSSFLENGTNGTGIEVSTHWGLDEFEGFKIGAGYSIAGILDLGADYSMNFYELEGYEAFETKVGSYYNVMVFKQDRDTFLSCQIKGFYRRTNISSDYLTTQAVPLIKRGSEFSVGTDLHRDFRIFSFLRIRLGLTGSYELRRIITDEIEPPATTGPETEDPKYPKIEQLSEFYYGFISGFLFKFKRGSVFCLGSSLLFDGDSVLRMVPSVSITIPSAASQR